MSSKSSSQQSIGRPAPTWARIACGALAAAGAWAIGSDLVSAVQLRGWPRWGAVLSEVPGCCGLWLIAHVALKGRLPLSMRRAAATQAGEALPRG